MREICFASNNNHKLDEVRPILGSDFRVLSLSDVNFDHELPETRNTFQGNAQQKAEHLFKTIKISCFADDSGLEVEALNGEPGIFSARYAGSQKNDMDNIELLLKNMKGISNRKAQFRTVIAYLDQSGSLSFFEGIIKGDLLEEKRGTSGFGYDPIFVPQGHTKTFAEMTAVEKNTISHRAIAVRKMTAFLRGN
jgi:XTP/dITP diphosphohydrolase